MLTLDDLVDDYQASLLEPDEDARREILARLWTDDCLVINPDACVRGRDALNAHITNIRAGFGGTPIVCRPADGHSGMLRFVWRIVDPGGELLAEGMNFGEQAPDGRLRKLVVFYGVTPGG